MPWEPLARSSPFNGRLYLVYTDRTTLTTNDTDIFVRHSDDSGSTWSAPVRVNDDPIGNGKSQFLPRITLDQTTGNIAVSFYDCRNSPLNNTTEYWAAVSTNGGASFLPNIKVNTGGSRANAIAVRTYKFDFGDYSGLAFYGGKFYPCWGDNSNSTGDNPEGTLTNLDMYTAAVIVEPSPLPLLITKLRATVYFARTNVDSCAITGTLGLPAGFSLSNKLVSLDIAGAQVAFSLDKKGRGRNYPNLCQLVYSKRQTNWTYTAVLKKGSWQVPWAACGMTNGTVVKPGNVVNLPVVLTIGTNLFTGSTNLRYTTTAQKSGIAK